VAYNRITGEPVLESGLWFTSISRGRWEPAILDRIKAYVSIEKRYAVTLKEDS
jgi:hypothetical protein